ncbi:conjugative transfer system coupling protein TraD [Pseudomonas aeruginosa]|jgi:conjugal transfer pilus assembly protein TraD|uniref:conjugative transfer system coupling protein TraD n=1 Tax=Pseudomonas aeruginosa TaxID=287 RepID=UPI000B5A357B|nr:conjugative transfer system coupling protein TraD [Pseudomonas aeruginosa]ASJ88553.1 putative traG-like protein [Pseudomonas aeruginosa]MBO8337294.1 conjugative transfer system coupling protein TraD [Pseudomonas aeruginosa]HCF4079499.1 conjugative transfer system coupling protein TraD [Pseudomonas aeruginosa]
MSEWNYEMPWRPNFEAFEAGVWCLGMLSSTVVHFSTDLPAQPFYLSLAVMAGFCLRRIPKAMHLYRVKQGLSAKDAVLMGQDELIKRMIENPKAMFLGEGYLWTQTEAQQIFELMKRDVTKLMPKPKEGFMGAPWIHGISMQPDEPIKLQRNLTSLHTLIVGTTGSGKTRLFDILISQAILRNEPVIILDPKGDKELANNARNACRLAGAPERFKYFHPAFPEDSVRISPTKNFGRPTEVASRIAALMKSEGGDPFQAFANMALNNVIQGLLLCGTLPTLVELRRSLEGGLSGLAIKAIRAYGESVLPDFEVIAQAYLQKAKTEEARAKALLLMYRTEIFPVKPSTDLEGLLSMLEHDKAHFGKMIASLLPVLNMLTSGHMGQLLSPEDDPDDTREITDSNKIIAMGNVLYMGLDSLSDSMVGSAIGSIFLADLAAVAGERYNFGKDLKPVNIFVDEAAETVNDQLVQLLNKGRGAGMNLFVATQTIADFEARMGSPAKAKQVLGNTNHTIALRVTDPDTQKFISEKIPPTYFKYVMRTQGNSTKDDPHMHSLNVGERLMDEEGELFPSQLLGSLPNLEFLAILAGGQVMKGKIPVLVPPKDFEKAVELADELKKAA